MKTIKVSYPEHKLRNEKAVSDVNIEEIFKQSEAEHKDRIRVIYELGICIA